MAKLILSMNQSLDGYVDHDKFGPTPALFRHFIERVGALTGSVYGRRMYEIMAYWDEDQPGWGAPEREFAQVWRRQPKWVASRTLTSVGPNATLIEGDVVDAVRRLKADHEGEIEVAGPVLAHCLADVIDVYQMYVHPVVTGGGNPFFAGPRPRLRLIANEPFDGDVVRLTYVPA